MDKIDDFLLWKKEKDLLMQYDAKNYSVTDLRLVYKHCDILYSEYMMSKEKGLCTEAAKDDCKRFWNNREKLFKGKMPEQEYERLRNELSFIRLELGT